MTRHEHRALDRMASAGLQIKEHRPMATIATIAFDLAVIVSLLLMFVAAFGNLFGRDGRPW